MRMLDLFSGFHGASQRFIDDDRWEVVSIDNEPRLSPTHVLDLGQVGAVKFVLELGKFDLIWASPPCIEFYKCSKPFWPEFYGKEPSMRLVQVALEIIKMAEPDFWILENTKHGAKFIKPLIGEPRQIHGPFWLWGNYPKFEAEVPAGIKALQDKRWDEFRSNHKARVPYEISTALHDVIMNQPTLEKWL
jgi:hypothetical protein